MVIKNKNKFYVGFVVVVFLASGGKFRSPIKKEEEILRGFLVFLAS